LGEDCPNSRYINAEHFFMPAFLPFPLPHLPDSSPSPTRNIASPASIKSQRLVRYLSYYLPTRLLQSCLPPTPSTSWPQLQPPISPMHPWCSRACARCFPSISSRVRPPPLVLRTPALSRGAASRLHRPRRQ
jgi:hypothetical protein